MTPETKRTLVYVAALVVLFLIVNFEAVSTQLPTSKELEDLSNNPTTLPEVINQKKEPEVSSNDLTVTTEPETQDPISSESLLPEKVQHEVPFVSQAPFGDWEDPDQQDGCEEISVTMAIHWALDKDLSKERALELLKQIISFEKEKFGYSADTNVADSQYIATEFYNYSNIQTKYNVTVEDIKEALANNAVVVAPMQGQRLNNPNFSGDGPEKHMLVITGYDDNKQQFTTNDPGTRRGEEYRYSYATIQNALVDYPSGNHTPITEEKTAILIINKS